MTQGPRERVERIESKRNEGGCSLYGKGGFDGNGI